MVLKARKKKKKNRKKLSLKKGAKAMAKLIYKHLIKLPEEERERDIAAIERAVARKLKRLKGKK
jgi:5-formyltetrahydrofolate cyclo-ligase